MLRSVEGWPAFSPGAANAWLLLVTTKPPTWRDPLLNFPTAGPVIGEPHEGFFYPDPLGFWAEVRRWTAQLVRERWPQASTPDALSLSAMLHVGEDPTRSAWAQERCHPVVMLFLDEASMATAGFIAPSEQVSIPDPHRPGTSYDGWWATIDGVVVGKAPQHPAAHNFYRAADMAAFLKAVPMSPV